MHSSLKYVYFFFFSIVIPLIGNAQDTTAIEVSYQLRFNISGRYISGTFSQSVYSNGLDFRIDYGKLAIHNTLSYRYNRTSNQVIENNWYELLTLSYFTNKKQLFPTAFYHFDNNLMFRVAQRHLTGAGVSSIKKWKSHSVRGDFGFGYDSSRYFEAQFENTELVSNTRERSVFIARLQTSNNFMQEKASLKNDFFYRHSLQERSDYFFMISSSIALKLMKRISAHVSYEYRFENVHLVGLSPYNSVLLFGLTYQTRSINKNKTIQ